MTLVTAHSLDMPGKVNSGPLVKLAIVGRGFTGLMTAIALLKGYHQPFHLVIFDPQPRIDGGEHLTGTGSTVLNSRVRDISIDPDVRDDFRLWLERKKLQFMQYGSQVTSIDHRFVSGETFSAYVYQRFSEALTRRADAVIQICPETVTAIEQRTEGGLNLFYGTHFQKFFDAIFLATGYGLRSLDDRLAAGHPVGDAVVVGGGLFAADRALWLLETGLARHVTLISASGYLPQTHTNAAVGPVLSDKPLPKTLRGAFRFLREAAENAEAEGSGWQGIMNGFRLRAQEVWQGLTPQERSRFKRHVKGVYDSHRNRLPPDHHQRLNRAIAEGSIRVRKGKVERIARNGVLLATPQGLEILHSERTLDCRFRPADLESTLYRSLFKSGLVVRDELHLGIYVDNSGRARTAANGFGGIHAMGPLGLGSLPDIDLVPQIVRQTYAAAASLHAWLADPGRSLVTGDTAVASGRQKC